MKKITKALFGITLSLGVAVTGGVMLYGCTGDDNNNGMSRSAEINSVCEYSPETQTDENKDISLNAELEDENMHVYFAPETVGNLNDGNILNEDETVNSEQPSSGLFDNEGKCIMTWEELVDAYPNAFEEEGRIKQRYGSSYFTKLEGNLVIDKSITKIDDLSFYLCDKLTSITIPATLVDIGGGAFKSCSSLERIIVEEGNPNYHSDGNCLIETATKTLLNGCKNSVIPSDGSVTEIGSFAFYKCFGLKSITIPAVVKTVGYNAFYWCTSLESVTISEGVEELITGAFSYCPELASVTISSTVKIIGEFAFYYCESIKSIEVAEGNTVYHSAGNCLIETETKKLILGCTKSVIPADGSVEIIGAHAFINYTALTSILIPKEIKLIEDYAFLGCTNLKTVLYKGSRNSWAGVKIGVGNDIINSADIYYYA